MPNLSPNVFHPTVRSAVGSRNSLAQGERSQFEEYRQVVEEETENLLAEITNKLPDKVLQQLDVMGGLKEKLYNYFNQNYQNMFNRYITTAEDEMVKKVRDFVDREEDRVLNSYRPKDISEIIDQVGGTDKFNTGEVEKSIVNIYGHLQGHLQRGVYDLETNTNSILRQKNDIGAFIRGENAYAIVKCAFKDNIVKPKTVTDVKLSINILDSELISPIFQYQSTVEFLIKDQIATAIVNMIDTEVANYQELLIDESKPELNDTELLFEKIKRIPNYTDDDPEDENSNRYRYIAKSLMDKIEGLRAEIDPSQFDALNVRESVKNIIDIENIRNRGFNTAINSMTAILDTAKMGYQYIENLKNARELVLREYEDTNDANLPDERYAIYLRYMDPEQLLKEQDAYDKQMEAFKNEITHVNDVIRALYLSSKSVFHAQDFEDVVKKTSGTVRKIRNLRDDPLYEEIEKTWNEIVIIRTEETEIGKLNRTYLYEKNLLKKVLIRCREVVADIYATSTPGIRLIVEKRLSFLEREFEKFDYAINPYHVQPGLLLDMDITSIKRKKFTLGSMANVLNEFLHGISKGFSDAAFATFKRRRSTMRDDLDQTFVTNTANVDYDAVRPRVPQQTSSPRGNKPKAASTSASSASKSAPSASRGRSRASRTRGNLQEL